MQTGVSALALKAEQVRNAAGTLGRQSVAATTGTGVTVGGGSGATSPVDAGSAGSTGPHIPGASAPGTSGTPPVLAEGRLAFGLLDNASGLIVSNGEVRLNTGTLENRSGMAHLTQLSVTGPSVDNTGGLLTVLNGFAPRIESFVNDQGKLLIGAAFDGAFGTFSNRQGLLQATHLNLDVARSLDNSGGMLRQLGSTMADITVGGELALGQGALDVASGLRLRAGSISGVGSVLNVTGDLDVEGGATSSAQGKWIVGGDAALRTGALDNSGGTIVAKDVTLTAGGAVDNSSGIIQAMRNIALNAAGGVVNWAGSIEALSSDSVMNVSAASIDNRAGRIANTGTGSTSLNADTVMNSGVIGGNGTVEIGALTLANEAAGSIRSVANLELAVREMLYNAGRIDTGAGLYMAQDSAQLHNSGSLVAVGDIAITAETVDNTAGTIATVAGHGSQVSLKAATLHNQDGKIDVDGHAVIDVLGHVDNQRGRIRADGNLVLGAGRGIENRGGSIETLGRLQVRGDEIANYEGRIATASTQGALIEATRGIDNDGLISANGQLTVKAQTFDNGAHGTVSATGDLELAVHSRLVNAGGTINTAGALNFAQEGAALVNSGAMTSAGGTRLTLDRVDNDGGTIGTLHGASIDLKANALSNRGGRVMAGADATVLVKGDIDSDAGLLQSARSIDIGAGGALRNQSGVIEALGSHGTLAVRSASIDNTHGRIANVGDGIASVSATGHVDNSGLIASNGQMEVAASTVTNAGTLSSASNIELAVSSILDNSGTISAATRLHIDQASAALRNAGTIVAGGPIEMRLKTVDNAGGKIVTAQGADADVLLTAQNIGNQGGAIMSGRHAAIVAEHGFDNSSGLLQAKRHLQVDAGGLLDASSGSIETLSADSTLTVHAGAVLNELGRIVNAGHGDTLVGVDTTLVSSGEIGGNGALGVEAQSVVNSRQGSIVAGGALVLQAHDSLENAGLISSGAALTIDEDTATLSNRGSMVAKGDIAIRASAIDNSGGTLATTDGSGASVTLEGTSLFNRDGRIVAERVLALSVSGALDNTRGRLQGVDAVRMAAGGDVTNDSGAIEATAAHATLVLQAKGILNGSGRVLNVGDGLTTVAAAESLESSGMIAGNGTVDLRADRVVNRKGGTLTSGGAMTASIGTRLENDGTMQSGTALHVAAQAAEVLNTGLVVAGGALTLTSAAFDNDGGQLATAKGSGGDLKVDAASISNRGGAILSDRDADVGSGSGFDNSHGTLQAAGSLHVNAAGAIGNDGGVVETLDPSAVLSLHANALDNGNGRIVNVGAGASTVTVDAKLSSRGLIAGKGSLTLEAAELENEAGGSIAAGTTLALAAASTIANAGLISSQAALTVSAARAAVRNSGDIVSGAGAILESASFDNSGGKLVTVAGSGGDIVLNASQVINASGKFVADGAMRITSGGVLDNRLGELRANTAVTLGAAGALTNGRGVIEAAGTRATMSLHAESIENTGGRIVNVGSGAASVAAANGIVNAGMLAANGRLDLSAATVDNLAAGTIAAGSSMDLHVSQALDNAGTVSAAGTLSMEQAAAHIINSGKIVAADRITLHGASISNDDGQVLTSAGADIDLSSASTVSNRAGVIAAAGNVSISAQGNYDNGQGQVHTPGRLQVTVGGSLANAGGTLEAVGTTSSLALQAASIDNTAGRVVNAGTGTTTVGSTTAIVNSGTIAGNGALALSARTLLNTRAGVIGSGDALEIGVRREFVNAGAINSGTTLRFGQADASFSNAGRIGAGGAIDITAETFSNQAGQLYTATSSGAAITLRANNLDNRGGIVSADGLLQAAIAGTAVNGGGTLHGGTGAWLSVGGALNNGSGTIETAAGVLEIEAASVDSSGRIINAGSGATVLSSATSLINSGMIAGNGALTLAAQTAEITDSGTIGSAGALDLTVRQQLTNAGTITSGHTIRFDQASASLTNSGRVSAAGTIDITAATIGNGGGQMYTASNSDAAIRLRAGSLDNIGGTVSADGKLQVVVGGGVANNSGTLHGGAGATLDLAGALANGSGTIEAAAGVLSIEAQSIDSGGRIVNAGTGAMAIGSATGVLNRGTIAGNGALVLSAETLQNSNEGTIGSGSALDLAIRQQLVNAGAITSQGTIRLEQAAASLTNTGRIGAASSIDITAAAVGNNGGQLYTVTDSGAAINLHTGSLDNTGGTVSADGLLSVEAGGSVANNGGLLRGGIGAMIEAGGALDNGSGAVEASSGALAIQAQSLDNSGRIVNAGSGLTTIDIAERIFNSGTVASNGALDVHASALENEGAGKLTSGQALLIDVGRQLTNAGTISSGGTLTFDQSAASFANSGAITAAGSMRFTAATFDNNGGHISTVRGSGTDITIAGATLNNRGGAILADRNVSLSVSGDVDNSQGTLQAGNDLIVTASGTISNTGGVVEALGTGSSLTLEGAAIHNGNGRISNGGSGDTWLRSQTGISNGGIITGMGNLFLSGQTLLNQAGATLASGGNLTLGISRELINHGKINSAGTLTFDQAGASFTNSGEVYLGGNAIINAGTVNNDGGRLGTGTGSGADLTLTSQQLSNRDGRIATDRDLVVDTHTFTSMGELFGGRDLALSMEGDYVHAGSVQNLRSNRDLSLSVSGNITNTSTMAAAGVLTLSGHHITNAAAASIEGAGVILRASGNLTNHGEINGENTLAISAANTSNSGGIVGGNVSLRTGDLDNSGSSALIGATGTLELGVAGTLNNTGGATLYSSGDMTISRHGGGNTDAVNNISSTIEAGGSLEITANSLINERENVEIVKVKTVDETVHMEMPSWYQFGENHHAFETSAANYRAHEVYFVSQSDILEEEEFVTPDGYTIYRAVIRTHANDSAFHVAASGLFGYYGAQSRLTPLDGTRVIWYTQKDRNVANPDHGAPAANAIVRADTVTNWSSTVSFSSEYGSCTSDCIRLITQPGYDDPRTTIVRTNQRSLGPVKEKLEVSREAHHTAVDEQLAPTAGAVARILSGGDMRLTVSSKLENRFGDIKARGRLILDGDATRNNVGATLYRTHTFDGTWRTYGGQTVAYQQPSISQVLGTVRGVFEGNQGVIISGRSFNNVDISAGTVGNIRDAIKVIGSGVSGASSAGAHIGASASTGSMAGAHVAAGTGIGDGAGTHVAAGTGVGASVGEQVSGSDLGAPATLASSFAATGGNHGLSAGLGAAASGVANHTRAGGKMTASGYANKPITGSGVTTSGAANDTVATGAVDQSGVKNNEHLISASSVSGNGTSQGDVATTSGPVVSQQARSVQREAAGSVMKVAPSGLFVRNPDAKSNYLYETRPQFANQKQWASSDYLFQQLEFDPASTQKRLGDGFYEQRLVREQLAELTGHTSYSGASDDSIYSQLLTNAVSAAKEFGLRPGVALSADQVSHLTSDIAWIEHQTVMLPDGSTATVLVPKVYLAHVNARTLLPGGALVTGNGVTINTTESILNRGGVIDGGDGRTLLLAGKDIINQGGKVAGAAVALGADGDIRNETLAVKQSYAGNHNSGSYTSLSNQATILTAGTLDMQAGRDVADLGGSIKAGVATITAGRDISFNTVQTGSTYQHSVNGSTQNDSSVMHALTQVSTSGDLTMAAGRDLVLSGTQATVGGSGALLAGRALTLGSVTNETKTDQRNDPASKTVDKRVAENQAVIGSSIAASGDLKLRAGISETASLTLSASGVAAGGAVSIGASGDVNIEGAQEKHLLDVASRRESSSALKKSSSSTSDYLATTTVVGSSVTGNSVSISAGNDVKINGSEVLADKALTLAAGRDLLVGSAVQVDDERHSAQSKKSGFSFSPIGGIGYSQSRQQQNSTVHTTTQLGSTLSGGSIVAIAGRDLSVQASNLVADADIALVAARNVSIVSAQDTRDSASDSSSKKSGSIGSAWQPALGTVKTTEKATSSSVTQVGSQVGSIGGNVSIQAGERYTQTASGVLAPKGDIDILARSVAIKAGYDTVDSSSNSTYSKVALGGTVSVPLVNAVQGVMGLASAAKQAGGGRMSALAAMTAAADTVDTVQQISQNGLTSGIKVSVSLGSTKSESHVVQTSSTAVGSQVLAGGDISIVATGGGKDSSITAIGSEINAGGNAKLRADNAIKLLAAENSFSQHSTNSSSGASVGIGFTFGGAQQGFALDLAASKAKGRADGEELIRTNTQVTAGGKISLQSGGDTTLKGGVVTGKTVQAAVGGDLKIESLQDRATYDSKQTSAGINASLCIPPFCSGASTVGGSVSKSGVKGDFQSVAQQSGIRAGDGGFQVSVGGSTNLIGGVVSSSQTAIDEKKNSLVTGSLAHGSLQNKDVYEGSGLSLSGSLSKNGKEYAQSMAPGIGRVSGTQDSVTRSGVSEGMLTVSDQQAAETLVNLARDVVTSKDTAQAITKRWDGTQAMDDVNSQMQITSAAMPRLAREIGDYAETKVKELNRQNNPEEAAKWAEGGIYRVAAHTALGALGGGLNGAVGGTAASVAAPTVQRLQDAMQAELADAGLSNNVANVAAKLIAGGAAGVIGGVVGGSAGATTGLNVDANNRQLHESESKKLTALKRGKSADEQHRLDAAACALVQCADGVPTSDPLYRKLQVLQSEGKSYNAEQMALKATGEFVYQAYLDPARDALTSRAELLRRTGGAINLGAGTLGTVGGAVVATGGVATCVQTLGIGCAIGAVGAYIATGSNQQATQGSQTLFGPFQSTEGHRVLNSLNARTFPGEKDPLVTAGLDALMLGTAALAGKVIPNGFAKAEELAQGARSSAAGAVGRPAVPEMNSIDPVHTVVRERVLGNIASSAAGRTSSQFEVHVARTDQVQWGYAPDEWSIIRLPAGTHIYGGVPGQSAYYTKDAALTASGMQRDTLFKSLQVTPHPVFGYRPQMGVYEVLREIDVPSGIVKANAGLGPGGATQHFISNYNERLRLLKTIDLGDNK